MTSVDDWLFFLKQSHGLVGFPLVVAGLGLTLFGWRMWKVSVMLSYALIGAAIGAVVAGPRDDPWLYALAIGAGLGLISYWPIRHAAALLGGLLGAGIVTFSLTAVGISGTALWSAGGAALIGCTAFAFLNRQPVVIVVTALLGAVLLVSGLTAFVMMLPGFFRPLHAMAAGSAIALPFAILVPTIASFFYQAAEIRRLHVNL